MPRILIPIAALASLMLFPAPARPHAQYKPFSLNRYAVLAFESPGLHVAYNITVGDLPAQRLRKRFDEDGDGKIDRVEFEGLVRWARDQIAGALVIRIDDKPVPVEPGEADVDLVTNTVEMMAPIWLRFHIRIPLEPGRHELTYHDQSEFPELGQTELFIRRTRHARIYRAVRPGRDRGVVERMFWEDGTPPGLVRIGMVFGESEASATDAGDRDTQDVRRIEDEGAGLKRALMNEKLGLWGLLTALGLAFVLGSFHALSPGHGKTLVAAYLVGTQGTVRHAVALGAIVSATHVSSVLILGLVALWASEEAMPDRLVPWTALAAGILVTVMGVWMFVRRVRGTDHHHHLIGGHHHDHDHHHDHNHDHDHHPDPDQPHEQSDETRGPAVAAHTANSVRFGELLGLGISGGLVPCPSAVVVLLFAIYLGRIGLGLGLIGAFSLGLAATLVIIGVLVVRGRALLKRLSKGRRLGRIANLLPLLSASAICIVGLVMTLAAALDL